MSPAVSLCDDDPPTRSIEHTAEHLAPPCACQAPEQWRADHRYARPADLVLLLRRGLDAGYLGDDNGMLTLSERGVAWLARHGKK